MIYYMNVSPCMCYKTGAHHNHKSKRYSPLVRYRCPLGTLQWHQAWHLQVSPLHWGRDILVVMVDDAPLGVDPTSCGRSPLRCPIQCTLPGKCIFLALLTMDDNQTIFWRYSTILKKLYGVVVCLWNSAMYSRLLGSNLNENRVGLYATTMRMM